MATSLSLPTSLKRSTVCCVVPCRTLLMKDNWCSSGTSWTPTHNLPTMSCSIRHRTGETDFLSTVLIGVCPPHSNEDWVNTHKLLSTTLGRAAKAALGKDGSRVQKYIMSGITENKT